MIEIDLGKGGPMVWGASENHDLIWDQLLAIIYGWANPVEF